jgi:hypothetical protein
MCDVHCVAFPAIVEGFPHLATRAEFKSSAKKELCGLKFLTQIERGLRTLLGIGSRISNSGQHVILDYLHKSTKGKKMIGGYGILVRVDRCKHNFLLQYI